jgi:hypothetical protein
VVVDRRVLAADLDVLLHDPPPLVGRQPVPLAALHERIDEQVTALEAARHGALLVAVLRRLAQPEERVGLRRPLHQPALRQHDVELVDAVEVLGLHDQHQVGVTTRTDERERLQQVIGAEVLAGGGELALVPGALGLRKPAPRGIQLEERVLDEVPIGHGRCEV